MHISSTFGIDNINLKLMKLNEKVSNVVSKLVEVGTFANVDDEDRVGNSLLHTWELRLGNEAKLLFRLSAQDFVKVLKLKFRQNFCAGVWSIFAADILQRL